MRRIIYPSKEQAVLEDDGCPVPDPGPNEVIVQSSGCGICQEEIKKFLGTLGGDFPVNRLGHESVGTVVKVGSDVLTLKEGDFVTTLWSPGFAEYFVVREGWAVVIDKPERGNEALWISEPSACALNGLVRAEPGEDDRVLLIGAGYMGLLLTQVFKDSACAEFLVTDLVDSKLEHSLKLGATGVIPAAELQSAGEFNIVIEAAGGPNMIEQAIDLTCPGGKTIVFADHRHHQNEQMNWDPFISKGIALLAANPMSHPDFPIVWKDSVELLKDGTFDQSTLISHQWPVEDCQEALEYSSSPDSNYIKGYFSWI
ncbi:MAG: zinc-binding dehydrogenase [Puniceicoccaceae bacterium]